MAGLLGEVIGVKNWVDCNSPTLSQWISTLLEHEPADGESDKDYLEEWVDCALSLGVTDAVRDNTQIRNSQNKSSPSRP